MALMKHKLAITMKLPQLQNFIKRDPTAYKDEFLMQYRHYESELDIFKLRPTQNSERFTDLVHFMSHVVPCYDGHSELFTTQLLDLLENNASSLHPDVRTKLFQSLVLLRNRDKLDPLLLLKLSFKLYSIPDKHLRTMLTDYIINDIKSMNMHKTNEKLNRRMQALLYDVVSEDGTVAARRAVCILSELYRRKVWTDSRSVNVIASACLSQCTRVMVAGIQFFLGIETKMHEDEEEEEEEKGASAKAIEINYHQHSKKTRARARSVKRQQVNVAKLKREKLNQGNNAQPLFPAIRLIHDPHSLAEKLFKRLRQSCERFEVKLLLMNFISRLIGCHELLLLSFYSFLQRYLTSHQQDVTVILTYLIQACHPMVPPDEITPVMRAISFNFITERCSNEVIAVGINSIREIINRIPAILREPGMDDFIQDLAQYGKKTHKSVMIAAHGVINLVREIYPTLLRKGSRGKYYNPDNLPVKYGEETVASGVAGVELLEAYERGEIAIDSDGEVVWKDEEQDDDDDASDAPDLVACDDDESDASGSVSGDENEDEDEEEVDASNSGSEASEDEDDEDDSECDEHENTSDGNSDQVTQSNQQTTRIDAKRLLTPEDFELLERLKAAQKERMEDPKFRSKRKRSSLDDGDDADKSFALSSSILAPEAKVGKSSKIERITNVLNGRKDKKFEHEGHAGGLTNKEKSRKKNYMMIRKGKSAVTKKSRKSNSEVRWQKHHAKAPMGRDKRKRRRT